MQVLEKTLELLWRGEQVLLIDLRVGDANDEGLQSMQLQGSGR